MNGSELERALTQNNITSRHFRGVFARDALPSNPRKGFYIMNFDKTGEPGSHWVCMEIGENSNTYFDSYGRKPPRFRHLMTFLGGKKMERNKKTLQHDYSTTCGQWCLYYIWRRCDGWTMKNITRPFNVKTPLVNDYVMNHLIRKQFRLHRKVIDEPFLKEQICREMRVNLAEWSSKKMKRQTISKGKNG